MIENIFWEKWRPKSIDDQIILPRIRKIIESDNIKNKHLIFFGHFGTGKTSLARTLVKDKSVLYSNVSIKTSIDNLREDVQRHVDTMSDIFNPNDSYKYVFLDEFEQASSTYQNGLKAFIEEYNHIARFIFVTNHIHKVEPGILSRCTKLDFDPNTEEEIMWWKTECKKRLIYIAEQENIEISERDIKRIVQHNFPDVREMIEVLGNVRDSGVVDYSVTTFNDTLKNDLFKVLENGDIVDLQTFIMENYGPEKIQQLFNLCGRPLLETLMKKRPDLLKTDKLGDIYSIVSEHSFWDSMIKGGDPIVTGTSCLTQIQKLIKNG